MNEYLGLKSMEKTVYHFRLRVEVKQPSDLDREEARLLLEEILIRSRDRSRAGVRVFFLEEFKPNVSTKLADTRR